MKLNSYDPKKGKVIAVGELIGTEFHKKVTSKHFHRLTQGYGVQENVIQRLAELGCRKVIIHSPTGKLVSGFQKWLDPEIKVQDYGHGKQRFMPVKYMKKERG